MIRRVWLLLLNTPPATATAAHPLGLVVCRVCADAAANRLRDSIQLVGDEDPDVVIPRHCANDSFACVMCKDA